MKPALKHFDVAERRRRLLARHHLAQPGSSVEAVAGDLVGLHATDPATVYLSLQQRLANFMIADLDEALYERRSLVRMLGMRRTMFVVPLDIAAEIDASCTKALAAAERRRTAQLVQAQGIDAAEALIDGACAATLAVLSSGEPLPGRALTPIVSELQQEVLLAEGKRYESRVSITNRILLQLSIEGHIVRTRPLGTWLSSQYRWTTTERWFKEPWPTVPVDAARTGLVRRWLRTYGPGTTNDIAWWTKWTKRQVAGALAELGAVEVTVDLAQGGPPASAWVLPDDLEDDLGEDTIDTDRTVAILPSLDQAVMGWKARDWILDGLGPQLFDSNGNAGPIVLVGGAAVGAWAQLDGGRVVTELLRPVETNACRGVEAAAAALTDWFAGVRITPRFPTPLQTRLAAGAG
jgi:hypothetical protein